MARTLGTYSLSANIETSAGAPLDARDIVPSMNDLTAVGSFPYHYIGMETYVVAVNKKYRLIGSDPTVLANWEEVGSGGGGSATIDGHVIKNKTGSDMAQRAALQFNGGVNVTDDSTNNKTVVTLPEMMGQADMSEILSPLPSPGSPFDLDDIGDVNVPNPSNGQVLKYDGTNSQWVAGNETGGPSDLDDLDDVAVTSPTDGQVLTYDAGNDIWVNADASGGGIGHTIVNGSGTSMTDRSNLQFTGLAAVSDDSSNNKTVVDVAAMPQADMSDVIYPLPTVSTPDLDDLGDVDISTPSDGQVLKYDSTSGKWENANDEGGTTVVANPSGTASTDLTKLQVGNDIYGIPGGGTTVVANPSGTATTDLTKLQVGNDIYGIPGGGVSSPSLVYHLKHGQVSDTHDYMTCNLSRDMVNGLYLAIITDGNGIGSTSSRFFYWEGSTMNVSVFGTLRVTETTAGLTYYSGDYRNIYCDIIRLVAIE